MSSLMGVVDPIRFKNNDNKYGSGDQTIDASAFSFMGVDFQVDSTHT